MQQLIRNFLGCKLVTSRQGLPPIVWGMLADDIPASDLEKCPGP